jgi:hypothetical protein
MKYVTTPRCLLLALALACLPFAAAQTGPGLPTAQPKRLTIIREQVKVGMGAGHAKSEAGWPAAFEKAKSPDYYIALTSMTGPTEAWFLIPSDSHAAEAASMKRDAKDPVLSAELDRLSLADAEYITSANSIQTMARPDLSLGKFPSAGKMRFFEIMFFSVRQGQEAKMDSIMKTYAAVRQRVSPDASYRVYNVNAGMPDPTYVVIQSVADYGEFDRTGAEHAKVFAAATPEETAIFNKWGEAVARAETNRFRVDPMMSYVPKEVRASDADFWMAK